MERELPKKGEVYKHFKDKKYEIIAIARDCETLEELVVYQALYGNNECYVRSLKDFVSKVDKEKYPDVTQEYRFEKLEEIVEDKTEEKIETVKEDLSEEKADNRLLDFLEAQTYREKMDCLMIIEKNLDEKIINNLAVSMDIILPEGSLMDKFDFIRSHVNVQAKYECNRLR